MAAEGTMRPGAQATQLALNMKLIAHNELAGFGGIGEGSNMQATKDGRRILWLAHESAPKNFTAVDVTDPKKPTIVIQTDLPHAKVRSNSLDVVGDMMAVAYQTKEWGLKPAGMLALDVARIEAGLLLIDVDFFSARKALTESQLYSPFELGLGRLVDFNKDHFVGRDALAAEHARTPRRRIVGVAVDWPAVEKLYEAVGLPPLAQATASRVAVPVFAVPALK